MGIASNIKDGRGTDSLAIVTAYGQLVTAPISYNSVQFHLMNLDDTAFNFVEPTSGKLTVISGLVINAGKNVSGTTASEIAIFEASSATSTVSTKDILQVDLLKLEREVVTNLNLVSSPGVWINATATDTDIKLSLLYYLLDDPNG